MVLYVCFFFFVHIVVIFLVWPYLPWEINLTEGCLALLCLLFLTLVNQTQPGYLKNGVDFSDLVRTIEHT